MRMALTLAFFFSIPAWAEVPLPPPLDVPPPAPVAPVKHSTAVTPPPDTKLIGTPPPADPYAPLLPMMVTIPAGTFTMGCKNGRDNVEGVDKCEKRENETPAHEVSVKAFRLSDTEVTFDEWDLCVKDGVCPEANDEGWGRGKRPVINVSWNDTQTYIGWLNKRTGKRYRLPTEAEWEYASRGGRNDTAYSWGYAIGKGNANCDGCGSQWDNKQTAPVKSFSANDYGLYDMHGNVWEWCQDKRHDNYTGAPADGSAWESGDSPSRVSRGGSWLSNARRVSSANRPDYTPADRGSFIGFRLASGQD